MKKIIIIFLIIAIIAATGYLFWQKNKLKQISINNNQPAEKQSSELQNNAALQEVSTSTPYIVSDKEISRGNPDKKQVIFTFDCGSGINSADKILEAAQKYNLKLTFFATGKFAEKYPETIKKIAANGHEIFNHTYSHPHLTQLSAEEIKSELEKADEIISNLTQKTTKPFFRPPYGDRNSKVIEIASQFGYQSVFWTFDALDWMPEKTPEQVKTQIYSHLSSGAIILMHVGDDTTSQILDEVFTKVETDGYKIAPLSEGIK